MKSSLFALLATSFLASLLPLASAPAHADDPPPAIQTDLVNVKKLDFSILQDIRYATANNFTKKVVYPEAKCLLRKPVAEALVKAQAALRIEGYALKVYDCYRPLSVQRIFWSLVPDERYVADPAKGSKHNRGAAVDVTLVDKMGQEVEMPSGYDDFSPKAHRSNKKMTRSARANLKRLEDALFRQGFTGHPEEWWHYDFKGWEKYPIEDVPLSAVP